MSQFKAVVFDWAGTMIDFGSFAPMGVFVEVFASFGVAISVAEARGPMGMPKRDHIATLLANRDIAERWAQAHGHAPTTADVDALYARFVPMNEDVVASHSELVPGAADMIAELRRRGLKIGSTTGYTRSIMERVLPRAAEQGYAPDNLVCSDDLPEGRPGPLGMYQCFIDLVVSPPSAVLKVDDTAPGIAEGVAAGCVTVGVTMSGNIVGKTVDELAAMSVDDIAPLKAAAEAELREAGADHIVDTVADLPSLIDEIEASG